MTEQEFNWENMKAGIKSQVQFLKEKPHQIYSDIKRKVNLKFKPGRIYLVGCGDSWSSGLAVFPAFEYFTGIPVTPCRSLMFSRYLVKTAREDSLVILISDSGKVSRTIEAALRAEKRGFFTLALTSNRDSQLAESVDLTLPLNYPSHGFAPATVSYLNSLVVLYSLAFHMGVSNQSLTREKVQLLITEISQLAQGLSRIIKNNESKLKQLGKSLNKELQLVFLGSGPNYGTAVFSATKLLESLCINAIGQDLEEWAHTQLLTTTANSVTFVLATPGASMNRAEEVVQALAEIPGKCVAITDAEDNDIAQSADMVIPVFGSPREVFSPLLYCVPAQFLAYFAGRANKTIMLGFDDPHIKELNFQQIHHSTILRNDV